MPLLDNTLSAACDPFVYADVLSTWDVMIAWFFQFLLRQHLPIAELFAISSDTKTVNLITSATEWRASGIVSAEFELGRMPAYNTPG